MMFCPDLVWGYGNYSFQGFILSKLKVDPTTVVRLAFFQLAASLINQFWIDWIIALERKLIGFDFLVYFAFYLIAIG
jgi:hypothetical protein